MGALQRLRSERPERLQRSRGGRLLEQSPQMVSGMKPPQTMDDFGAMGMPCPQGHSWDEESVWWEPLWSKAIWLVLWYLFRWIPNFWVLRDRYVVKRMRRRALQAWQREYSETC